MTVADVSSSRRPHAVRAEAADPLHQRLELAVPAADGRDRLERLEGDRVLTQTAETSSSSATRNEDPQPQAAITFGLSTLKPAPWRPSTKSITDPST
jgi:hypothetical protein